MREQWLRHLEQMQQALVKQDIEEIQSLLSERQEWNKEDQNWNRNDISLLEQIMDNDRKVAAWIEKEHRELGEYLIQQNRGNRAEKKYRQF